MRLTKQTKLSTPDGSIRGNCFRACLSSIMDLDIEDIPHFEDMGQEWHEPFFNFLKEKNYEFEGTGQKKNFDKLKRYEGIEGCVIVFGKSPREYVKSGHAVIYKNGEFFFDPHPSNEGLTEVEGYYMITKLR